tara:strand:- start:432 stop:1022 length:591 start_codon:yes stop_codon:yes gene_type:complete
MKIRFIICPDIPSKVKSTHFKSNNNLKNKGHDWRSAASEHYAFEYIGIKKILYCEDELILKYAWQGIKIPECIAVDPLNPSNNISIEVKRICGNNLPQDYVGQDRRTLRERGDKITWPWGKTIHDSLSKAHPLIVSELNVHTHHSIFVVPKSLSKKKLKRLCNHVYTIVCEKYYNIPICNTVVHVIQGDDIMFDRL